MNLKTNKIERVSLPQQATPGACTCTSTSLTSPHVTRPLIEVA